MQLQSLILLLLIHCGVLIGTVLCQAPSQGPSISNAPSTSSAPSISSAPTTSNAPTNSAAPTISKAPTPNPVVFPVPPLPDTTPDTTPDTMPDTTQTPGTSLPLQVSESPSQSPSTSNSPTQNPLVFPVPPPAPSPTRAPSGSEPRQTSEAPSESPLVRPTPVPTPRPSPQPTAEPTAQPTAQPTPNPTRSPTSEPTMAPSEVPTLPATNAPSNSPSTNPTFLTRLEQVIRFLSGTFEDEATLRDPNTPQGMAALWIADEDPLVVPIPASTAYPDAYRFVQRYALVVLYFEWTGATTMMTKQATSPTVAIPFLTGTSECRWNSPVSFITGETIVIGAQCNDQRELTYLNLPSMNLQGTIPDELGLLVALTHLTLPRNNLQGEALTSRWEFLNDMSILDLSENQLTGTLPSEALLGMSDLTRLRLGSNLISGFLPVTMANLTSLTALELQDNNLFGVIEILNFIPTLRTLNLAQNRFAGRISQLSLVNLANLMQLDLSFNFFEGEFPMDFFQTRESSNGAVARNGNSPLRFLRINNNELGGDLDAALVDLPNLIALDSSNNVFTGPIPVLDGILPQLQFLSLANNPWQSGSIPWELVSTTQFRELNLANTNRVGTIPSWLCMNQFDLTLLRLDHNQLYITIPDSLGFITSLRYLLLNDNSLDGTLPVSMVNLQRLRLLRIDGNLLEGTAEAICQIPSSQVLMFSADCGEVECACCTHCSSSCGECEADTNALLSPQTWTHNSNEED